MRIDSHQHFWKFDPIRDAWITSEMSVIQKDFLPEDLAPLLRENRIDRCVSVQADQSENETDFLLSLASSHDFISGVVGWVDLKAPNLRERLSHYKQFKKLKGFRHIVQAEPPGFLTDPAFRAGVRTLADFGYTYNLLIYHYQLKEAIQFVHALPDVKIVVDHIAKPSIRTGEKTHWELNMAALSSFPNVLCKVSGMVTEAVWKQWEKEDFFPFLDEVFETFGASRIMYGSDWPVCLVSASYQEQLSVVEEYISRFSKSEQEGIMGTNAFNFYNL